ncbi:MAG: nucleotide exchange factor GrpE [Chloroflexota bacterium]|nr:nucleotide exchange factor GrpE [Chloroflexota bacterium]MDE2946655.1 nucleotide exchange factor GrpE [Chloroflexota bacterium]
MSDVKNPADELEREEMPAEDAAEPTEEATAEQAEAAVDATQDELELPEGANLMQLLIEAQKEAKANEDGWQRARAEFANFKKRNERERREVFQRAALDTLKSLLPIIDDFDRAFESVPEAISENPWIGGVSMIQRKFSTLLEQYEVEAIDPTGGPFDPNLHQAIGAEDSDEVESGHVIETLQKGYRAGEQVLRLALVKVAS